MQRQTEVLRLEKAVPTLLRTPVRAMRVALGWHAKVCHGIRARGGDLCPPMLAYLAKRENWLVESIKTLREAEARD
jgi:hypothetical protein